MGRATGLGKRKRPASADDRGEEDADVYFAADEAENEVEQAATMLAHAEMCLEEREKCIPLLRAVIHECDRLGKLKEALEGEEDAEGDASETAAVVESLSEEERARVKGLTLDAKFYQTFGDALFRLAILEAGEEEPCNEEMLKVSIQVYRGGLAENDEHQHPPSLSLISSLKRALILAHVSCGEEGEREISAWLDLIVGVEDAHAAAPLLARLFETVQMASDLRGVMWEAARVEILERVSPSLSQADPTIGLGLIQMANDALDHIIGGIESDETELTGDASDRVETILRLAQSHVTAINLDEIAQSDPDVHTLLLPAISQLFIWSGCWADMQDRAELANAEYSRAVAAWEECSTRYGMEIPEEVLALKT